MRALAVGLLLVTACGSDGGDGDPPEPTPVTWYRDVAPILAEHCMGCHQDGGIAPFSLTEYEYSASIAPSLMEAIDSGLMPPFDAREKPDCTPRHGWKDDPRLDEREKGVLRAWIADGTPAGTEAELPPLPVYELTGVTNTLRPTTPFVTTGETDQFICFALDPQNAQLAWVNGLQIRAGNPDVVHHAVTVALFPKGAPGDPDGPNEILRATNMIGVPFDCADGGVTTLPNSFLLGVWTPGNQPIDLPTGVAAPLLGRSLVLVQIHYHPGGRPDNAPDATEVDLRLVSDRPTHLYTATAVGNAAAAPTLQPGPADRSGPEFRIPANAEAHTEHMRFTLGNVENPVPLFSAYPHMHYIGTGIDVTIERAAPSAAQPADECLVSSDWNFDWQRSYLYDAPLGSLPTLANGDVIDVACSYDNTLRNPFVVRALADAGLSNPIDVFLGEETLDEMCLGIFGVVVPLPPPAKRAIDEPAVRALLAETATALTPLAPAP